MCGGIFASTSVTVIFYFFKVMSKSVLMHVLEQGYLLIMNFMLAGCSFFRWFDPLMPKRFKDVKNELHVQLKKSQRRLTFALVVLKKSQWRLKLALVELALTWLFCTVLVLM